MINKNCSDLIQSICSIINVFVISLVSIFIGITANSIAKTQNDISLAQNNPQFVITEKHIYNDEHIVDNRVITVNCNGGYFTNYESNIITLIKIVSNNSDDIKMPLLGYWFDHGRTGNVLGTIETISANDNYKKYCDLRDLITETYDNILYIEIENYIHISYYDIMQSKQDRFYVVYPITGTQIIEEDLFSTIKKEYNDWFENNYYIDIDSYSKESLKSLNLFN